MSGQFHFLPLFSWTIKVKIWHEKWIMGHDYDPFTFFTLHIIFQLRAVIFKIIILSEYFYEKYLQIYKYPLQTKHVRFNSSMQSYCDVHTSTFKAAVVLMRDSFKAWNVSIVVSWFYLLFRFWYKYLNFGVLIILKIKPDVIMFKYV